MQNTRNSHIFPLWVIILLVIVRSSHQAVYSCNISVSCGCSANSVTVSRIVGGEAAGSATWTWAVSISIDNNYLCGGSIISSSWIITAAHCVNGYTASKVTIYAGSNRRWAGTQSRVVSQIIIHSSYNTDTYVNDIALLRLATPLVMTDPNVKSICIPSISSAVLAAGEWPSVGTNIVAVGWGTLTESGSVSSTLQQVTVQTVSYQASTCTSVIDDWHVQFCAGVTGGGKDTCQGDSGGPIMMFTASNQWVLVGVTSNGIGCARATYAGIYTRVAAFQDWIRSNTNGSFSVVNSSVSTASTSTTQSTISTASTTTVRSTVSTASTTTIRSTVSTASTSTIRSTVSTASTSTVRSTVSSASTSSIRLSASTSLINSPRSTVSTPLTNSARSTLSPSSLLHVHLHVNTVVIFNVFVFASLNFLIKSYF